MRLPFTSEPVEFRTSLPIDDVVRRFRQHVAPAFVIFRSRTEFPIAGSVQDDGAQLYRRPPFFARNSFVRVLALKFSTDGNGTILRGPFRLPRLVVGFMSFWFSFVILFCVTFSLSTVRERGLQHILEGGASIPFGMLVFGILLVNFGVWLSRSSEHEVVAFVTELLSDTPREGTVGGDVWIRPTHLEPK